MLAAHRPTAAAAGPYAAASQTQPLCATGRPPAVRRYAALAQPTLRPCSQPARHVRAIAAAAAAVAAAAAPADSSGEGSGSGLWARFSALANALTNLFPVFVLGAAVTALAAPTSFDWFDRQLITPALAVTMLGMGLTLTFDDFKRVLTTPGRILAGFALQYTVMPLMAFAVSRLAGLPLPFAIGLCIVGSCPGGTASNVVTYLARADVTLSVAMTTASTLGAVVATPLLTQLLLGTLVPVDAAALLISTLQVVLAPVVVGAAINSAFPEQVATLGPLSALSAVLLIALICGSVMAQNAAAVLQAGPQLLAAVFALHAGGFFFGYALSKVLGLPERAARTNSIEVGMQNSALGAVLATAHFPAHPLAAVPCAISACMHSIMGSLLAAMWRGQPTGEEDDAAAAAAPAAMRGGCGSRRDVPLRLNVPRQPGVRLENGVQGERPGEAAAPPAGPAVEAIEGLPVPLDHVLSECFRLYEARTPEELVKLLRQRYAEDATFVDPTLVARPRRGVALSFYALQHMFCQAAVTGIGEPQVELVPAPDGGGSLLQVVLHSTQRFVFSRTNGISKAVLPEDTCLETRTRLLIDPHSGLVVRHEDEWQNVPTLHLPLAWRRLNGLCMGLMWRMLGWQRELAEAERRCAAAWE
ncbi:putative sodium metabolite cotransporter chloroplastic [Micractinium conductrix]|uniref:Sodium metabolite cotransporter chloroplastic n=1 Tax=Micractinium conductrix TaxID=554055 RepID=A0A2P6VLM1_9CHLO|nr:putative sodium metabolite cotransporter chloroplastic [Micractinium conductrix]|eukprot:PSC74970.1 putative sodium metabolite cotransporter chloroplastic [Micractinium conductrix]